MKQVELTTAYEWICDECGRSNFCSSTKLDMSKEENEQSLRIAHGLQPYEPIPDDLGGEWVTRPDHVTCDHCGETYATKEP